MKKFLTRWFGIHFHKWNNWEYIYSSGETPQDYRPFLYIYQFRKCRTCNLIQQRDI